MVARLLDAGLSIAIVVVGGYVAIAAYLFFSQASFIYFPEQPGRSITANPGDIGLTYDEVWLRSQDGVRLHGWFIPTRSSEAVLFLHGNAGNISHRLDSIRLFHELGLNVLIFDYRGYGQSDGTPSEQGTYLDAHAGWQWLIEEGRFDPSSIVIFGRSLGGSIAAWLASRERAGALIVESAFTSVPDMGQRLYPWLPVRWLSRIDYPTQRYVAEATCPVLVVHSSEDEIIPFEHGRAIFDSAPEPKAFLQIRGGHNDGFVVSPGYPAGLREFLETNLGANPPR